MRIGEGLILDQVVSCAAAKAVVKMLKSINKSVLHVRRVRFPRGALGTFPELPLLLLDGGTH